MIAIGATPEEGLELVSAEGPEGQLGKRYKQADGELEVLVTKAGAGVLAAGGAPLVLKDSKPLPASD